MLKIVNIINHNAYILDTDDDTIEHIDISDLVSLVNSKKVVIDGLVSRNNYSYIENEDVFCCYYGSLYNYVSTPKLHTIRDRGAKYPDYIYVSISVTQDVDVDFIKDNKSEFDRLAYNCLLKLPNIANGTIKRNWLKLERLTLRKDCILEYVFGFKKIEVEQQL